MCETLKVNLFFKKKTICTHNNHRKNREKKDRKLRNIYQKPAKREGCVTFKNFECCVCLLFTCFFIIVRQSRVYVGRKICIGEKKNK